MSQSTQKPPPQQKTTSNKQWRSLAQWEGCDSFTDKLGREFPVGASEFPREEAKPRRGDSQEKDGVEVAGDDLSRRAFLKTMAAPLALAGVGGLTGCGLIRKPERKIYPYAQAPESIVPGNPLYYATTYSLHDDTVGLVVESHEGRPTKIEGNRLHPESQGKTKPFQQASILDLYNPDRLQAIKQGTSAPGVAGVRAWLAQLELAGKQGAQTGILYAYQSSPTFYRLLGEIKERYPLIKSYCYNAISQDAILAGVEGVTTTQTRALPQADYERADVVLALDSDFLGAGPGNLANQIAFTKRRNPDQGVMNRLYHYESSYTITGAMADHRFRLRRQDIEWVVYRLFYRFYEKGIKRISKPLISLVEEALGNLPDSFLKNKGYRAVNMIVDDLLAKTSQAVIVAGAGQSPLVHALVAYMNEFIEAPVKYYANPFANVAEVNEDNMATLRRLAYDVRSGDVANIINLESDPLYTAPQDIAIAEVFSVVNTLTLSLYANDTTAESAVVVPAKHYLETWSDAYTYKGVLSLVQPLVTPLYAESHSASDILALVLGAEISDKDRVQATHGLSVRVWRRWLHDGVALGRGGLKTEKKLVVSADRLFAAISTGKFALRKNINAELELTFDGDYSVGDGSFYNNVWMQELPDPITKLTWENAVIFSYVTAQKYGVQRQDVVQIKVGQEVVEAPVWVAPGQADDSIALKLGYGQKGARGIAAGSGCNAYALRQSGHLGVGEVVNVLATGKEVKLASVQDHWAIDDELFTGGASSNSQNDRPLYRSASLVEYQRRPNFAKEAVELPVLAREHARSKGKTAQQLSAQRVENMSVYEEKALPGEYQWGLAIDLNTCTGCNACVVACQAENNVPVVGKEMVIKGREMHWLRIDRYFEGEPEDAQLVQLPVMCMQCEQAPCEQVCPVAATVHSSEGLNDMVYNRCVGTRFCSNNCPYKVRRFNYLDYHGRSPHSQKRISSHVFDLFREPKESLQMQFNPNVTVRMRGVMEKCTYCVQRINAARVVARNEKRKIADGDIVTACEQACPSASIVFGNIADKSSRVSQKKAAVRDYVVLEELNVKPRTSYGAAITNPNPILG